SSDEQILQGARAGTAGTSPALSHAAGDPSTAHGTRGGAARCRTRTRPACAGPAGTGPPGTGPPGTGPPGTGPPGTGPPGTPPAACGPAGEYGPEDRRRSPGESAHPGS